MGTKTIFGRTATERKDLDVLHVFNEPAENFPAPVVLEVDVKITLTD